MLGDRKGWAFQRCLKQLCREVSGPRRPGRPAPLLHKHALRCQRANVGNSHHTVIDQAPSSGIWFPLLGSLRPVCPGWGAWGPLAALVFGLCVAAPGIPGQTPDLFHQTAASPSPDPRPERQSPGASGQAACCTVPFPFWSGRARLLGLSGGPMMPVGIRQRGDMPGWGDALGGRSPD